MTAGASAPPGSAFQSSASAAEKCRRHRGLWGASSSAAARSCGLNPVREPRVASALFLHFRKVGAFLPTFQSSSKQSQQNRSPQELPLLQEVSQRGSPLSDTPRHAGVSPPHPHPLTGYPFGRGCVMRAAQTQLPAFRIHSSDGFGAALAWPLFRGMTYG